ncbi:MAG TPA: DUF1592 domain-containing protein [Polyangiaceae bacterium]|nr:DUF1592 domain-containing protein [Polyangiaceae bacterium]
MIAAQRARARSQLTACWSCLGVALAALGSGCQADISGGDGSMPPASITTSSGGGSGASPGGVPPTCTGPQPGPSPLRRLTHREYDNTVRDLLGDDSHPSAPFSREDVFLGFDNSATARGTTTLLAEQYSQAAEQLAAKAVQNLSALTGCNAADTSRDACARSFIERFGAKAFRGPLTDAERTRFGNLYGSASQAWGFSKGIELTLAALLQSSRFLYRVEFGTPSATPGVNLLTPFELAARLSYLLWGSLPDQALLDAAGAGQLSTREQIASQARRLLADTRAHYVLNDFHRQWLALDAIDTFDSTMPGFSNDLRPLLHEEAQRTVEATLFEGDGKLKTLLTAPFSFLNAPLAAFYGLSGPTTDAFEKVPLDAASQRIGILTQGGILAAHSHAAKTSPVLRGKFVREQLLCNPPPPPPPGVDFTVSEKDASLTVRQQSEQHRADPACAACHRFMDPIGLSFEAFDAVGRLRARENDAPVVTTGELIGTDVDGAVSGPAELAQKLAGSQQVSSCFVRQWFRYAYGRDPINDRDACGITALENAFAQSDGTISELLFALTQTDAFQYRSVAAGEMP